MKLLFLLIGIVIIILLVLALALARISAISGTYRMHSGKDDEK